MQISQKLPQFRDERALFVVTGRQEAAFYLATKGVMKMVEDLKIKTPRYTDREGFFKMRGRGRSIGAAAPEVPRKEWALQDFMHAFRPALKRVLTEFSPTQIYFFTPGHLINQIRSVFPTPSRKLIKKTIRGDFYGEHPFELLRRIL